MRLSGETFDSMHQEAELQDMRFTPAQRASVANYYADLLAVRVSAGAFYRSDDPDFDPGESRLRSHLEDGTDPDAQLRLAYYYELQAKDAETTRKAMDLYRIVRDQRVSSVRFKIGAEYDHGTEGFPHDPLRAAQWYSFAAKAGSKEACKHLQQLDRESQIPHGQAMLFAETCPAAP